jgi:hypothetical protein
VARCGPIEARGFTELAKPVLGSWLPRSFAVVLLYLFGLDICSDIFLKTVGKGERGRRGVREKRHKKDSNSIIELV